MDTVSIILVPEEVREDTLDRMSPRVNKIYKKNLKNIFEFNHETFEKLEVIKSHINAGKNEIRFKSAVRKYLTTINET